MKIWFDTEFIEDGKTIDLISIGMVREDGETYYAENAECRIGLASDWVKQNVIPHLTGKLTFQSDMQREIVEFAGEKPEFWADYASYDWVALCQIFGTMMQLPEGWPMYCNDIQQLRNLHVGGGFKIPVAPNKNEHNALADAKDCKAKYEWLWEHRD